MKQANLAFFLALAFIVILFKIATRKTGNPIPDAASFQGPGSGSSYDPDEGLDV